MTNPTGSPLFVSDRGSQRDGDTYSGSATYALNATTVLSFSGDYHKFVDASRFGPQPEAWTFASIYPNSNFYKALYADASIPVLAARMSISGDGGRWVNMGPGGGTWNQRPSGNGFDAKIAQQRGSHYLKAGFETLGTQCSELAAAIESRLRVQLGHYQLDLCEPESGSGRQPVRIVSARGGRADRCEPERMGQQ